MFIHFLSPAFHTMLYDFVECCQVGININHDQKLEVNQRCLNCKKTDLVVKKKPQNLYCTYL